MKINMPCNQTICFMTKFNQLHYFIQRLHLFAFWTVMENREMMSNWKEVIWTIWMVRFEQPFEMTEIENIFSTIDNLICFWPDLFPFCMLRAKSFAPSVRNWKLIINWLHKPGEIELCKRTSYHSEWKSILD